MTKMVLPDGSSRSNVRAPHPSSFGARRRFDRDPSSDYRGSSEWFRVRCRAVPTGHLLTPRMSRESPAHRRRTTSQPPSLELEESVSLAPWLRVPPTAELGKAGSLRASSAARRALPRRTASHPAGRCSPSPAPWRRTGAARAPGARLALGSLTAGGRPTRFGDGIRFIELLQGKQWPVSTIRFARRFRVRRPNHRRPRETERPRRSRPTPCFISSLPELICI